MESEPLVTTSAPPGAESHRVAAALAELREDERELLLLVAWEGLDATALAAVLRCSRNAARIRLHRARRHFAHVLAELADDAKRPIRTAPLQLEDRP